MGFLHARLSFQKCERKKTFIDTEMEHPVLSRSEPESKILETVFERF